MIVGHAKKLIDWFPICEGTKLKSSSWTKLITEEDTNRALHASVFQFLNQASIILPSGYDN